MMAPEAGQSRFDTVLKMLLIAFVSLLAFSSGVYFGREMTEKDYKFKAAEAEFDSHSAEPASEKREDFALHDEDAVTDEDVETLTTNAVKGQAAAKHGDDHGETHGDSHAERKTASAVESAATAKHGDTHGDSHGDAHGDTHAAPAAHAPVAHAVAKPAAAKNAKPDLKDVHEAARRVANNETPSAHAAPHAAKPASESRIPQSLPKSVGSAKDVEYTVQVASYPSLDEAKSHANQLVSKGFAAFPVEAEVKGKTWYRVSVGSFKSQKEANEYRATLIEKAELKSALVQKIKR